MSSPSFIQAAPAIFGSSGTITGSFSAAVAANDAIIVGILYQAGTAPSAVSDSVNGSYAKVCTLGPSAGSNAYIDVWAVFNVIAGSPIISINTNGAKTLALAVEYTGLTAVDVYASGYGGGGQPSFGSTTWNAGSSATTAQANEILLTFCGDYLANAGQSWTGTGGSTVRSQAEESISSSNLALCIEDEVLTSIISFPHTTATSSQGANYGVTGYVALKYTPASFAVTTSSLPPASQVQFYSESLATSGGIGPYSWEITSGSLPPGFSLSSSGTITGTPTASGTFTFTVQVTDSASNVATKSLSIVVAVLLGGYWAHRSQFTAGTQQKISPLKPWFNPPRRRG
jgi:Putative Ig domain